MLENRAESFACHCDIVMKEKMICVVLQNGERSAYEEVQKVDVRKRGEMPRSIFWPKTPTKYWGNHVDRIELLIEGFSFLF